MDVELRNRYDRKTGKFVKVEAVLFEEGSNRGVTAASLATSAAKGAEYMGYLPNVPEAAKAVIAEAQRISDEALKAAAHGDPLLLASANMEPTDKLTAKLEAAGKIVAPVSREFLQAACKAAAGRSLVAERAIKATQDRFHVTTQKDVMVQ